MDPHFLMFVLIGGGGALLIAVKVLTIRQDMRGGKFREAARAQALKSQVELELRQGKYPELRLSIQAADGAADRGRFEVRREGAADRLVEGLSLSKTIRTLDPIFIDRFHIDSDDESFASAFFSDMGKRSAVEALFAAGCTSLVWDEGDVTAVWKGFQPKDENADFVGAAAEALRALTRNTPAPVPVPVSGVAGESVEKRFNAYFVKAMIVGVPLVYGTVVFHRSLPGRPVDVPAMLLASLRFSIPLAAFFVLSGLSPVRGKSWFLKAAGKLILASVLLFPAGGYAGYAWANSFLDTSPAASYVLPVVEKHSIGRHRAWEHPNYYVSVAPWRPGLANPSFAVDHRTYNGVQPGRTQIHLTTRPGRFGHEWIVSLSFSDS